MNETWIAYLGIGGTFLLVGVGLLNYSIFRRQLDAAQKQIDAAMRQLALAQRQPDMLLIQRATAETAEHARVLVERPYLRPYFYESRSWREGDQATPDEIKCMAELMLINFASALMHSATFPEYPVRGVDRTIAFHLRNSPALQALLLELFDRFPFSGLSLLVLKNGDAAGVEQDLRALIAAPGIDEHERVRREGLLQVYQQSASRDPIEFTVLSMTERRWANGVA